MDAAISRGGAGNKWLSPQPRRLVRYGYRAPDDGGGGTPELPLALACPILKAADVKMKPGEETDSYRLMFITTNAHLQNFCLYNHHVHLKAVPMHMISRL